MTLPRTLYALAALLLPAAPAAAQGESAAPAERIITIGCPAGPTRDLKLPAQARDGDYVVYACGRWSPVLNGAELTATMSRGYPVLLRDAGIGGVVEVRFAALPDGTVDSTSVSVLRATHQDFAPVAVQVITQMRLDMSAVDSAAAGRVYKRIWLVQPVQFSLPY